MDFEDKLEQAIQRGQDRNAAKANSQKKTELSKEAIRNRYNEIRLNLSDHIEVGLKKIASHFPGFEYETIYGAKGWGGALSRNDLDRGPDGKAGSFFSRVEMTVRPQNEFNVINIVGKGTIRDKELFVWNHYDSIAQSNQAEFIQMIDNWLLQFAEQFAAR